MNPRYLKGSSDTDEVFKADLRINVTEFFGSSAVVREESRTPAGACHCEHVWLQRDRDPNGPPRSSLSSEACEAMLQPLHSARSVFVATLLSTTNPKTAVPSAPTAAMILARFVKVITVFASTPPPLPETRPVQSTQAKHSLSQNPLHQ